MHLTEELLLAANLTPQPLCEFQRTLPSEWIEEALHATGTATLRRRRLPAKQDGLDEWLWLCGNAKPRCDPQARAVRESTSFSRHDATAPTLGP